MWVVQAKCSTPKKAIKGLFGNLTDARFVRGVGREPFPTWPLESLSKAIDAACQAPELSGPLEHPFEGLTEAQIDDFIYSDRFDEAKIAAAVQHWGRSRN